MQLVLESHCFVDKRELAQAPKDCFANKTQQIQIKLHALKNLKLKLKGQVGTWA